MSRSFFPRKLLQHLDRGSNAPTTKLAKNPDQKLEWIDYFFHFMWPTSRVNYDKWPKSPPNYREVTEEYGEGIKRVAEGVPEALSVGLGLEAGALKEALGGEVMSLEMKINLYPPCPTPIPGLQVIKDGSWVSVDYVPDALVVHVGDQIEVLSNGRYKSVLHKSSVSKDETRMSWAVFFVPPPDKIIGPLPHLLNETNPPLFSTKTFKDFQHRKINKLPQ
ncbi:hypothetical protein AMTRI_Chr04g246710 [Amborella trichopoda]